MRSPPQARDVGHGRKKSAMMDSPGYNRTGSASGDDMHDPAMAVTTPGEMADEIPPARRTRRARARTAAAAHGVPLATIIVSVAVVSGTYLAGKLIYRLRDMVLLMVVAGFIALLLNPLVLYLQR
jgi:hypothetical protein